MTLRGRSGWNVPGEAIHLHFRASIDERMLHHPRGASVPGVLTTMHSKAAALAATNIIQQHQVDEVADHLLSQGKRPTTVMVQKAIGGDRLALVGFLEDWARRLHCRVAGRTAEEVAPSADRAATQQADLELMREAEAIQRKARRSTRIHKKSQKATPPGETAARRQALLSAIQESKDKLRVARERTQAILAALQATQASVTASELRLKELQDELRAIP
jgi:hypothetical protein